MRIDIIMKNKIQPKPIQKINCPKCGELQLKIYPWSSFRLQKAQPIPICAKCQNSSLKSGVA